MANIELTIHNPFATKSLRSERDSTAFTRAYAQLTLAKKSPGKIIPIFAYLEGDYRIFGILTLNIGGSVSFFPDFYKLDNFDHLTLNANFIQKKGHFTKVEESGARPRLFNFEGSPLTGNDYYHLITFGMDNGDLLMDAPSEIELPKISYSTEEERLEYTKLIENSAHGHSILEFPDEEGAYFVQILVLPKEKSIDGLAVERTFIEKLLVSQTSLERQIYNCKKIEIPTPEKSDFSICILTLRVPGKVKGSFGFMMAQKEIT